MSEKFSRNHESKNERLMQEYSVANITKQLETFVVRSDEVAMDTLMDKIERLEDVGPDAARTIMLTAACEALEAHQEYLDYVADDGHDPDVAERYRKTAKYHSLIAGEIGNKVEAVATIVPATVWKRPVTGESFKAELGIMARDHLLRNPPDVLDAFYEDAFPGGVEKPREAHFTMLNWLVQNKKKLALGALVTATTATTVMQPAAAAQESTVPADNRILYETSVSASPTDFTLNPSAEFIEILPATAGAEVAGSQTQSSMFETVPVDVASDAPADAAPSPFTFGTIEGDATETTPSESEQSADNEPENDFPQFEEVAPSAQPSAEVTESAPIFPQENVDATAGNWGELPLIPAPEPKEESKGTFIPAAPEKPAPEPEQGNRLKMNERQMEIKAAERLMERGGEWHNIGFGLKYLIEKGNQPPAVASAYVGSFLHEAPGMDPNTHQYGGGPGRGIAQWEGPGRFDHPTEGLLNYANNIVHRPWNDLETQLGFVVWETTNGGYETQMHQIVLDTYHKTGSLAQTADAVVDWYERAGVKAYDERRMHAERAALAFDEEYKKVERENNDGGVRVQSSNIVEIEPVAYVQKTAGEAPDEAIAAARVITEGDKWSSASYATWHLIAKSNMSPRIAIALASNLTFSETSGKYDGAPMKMSRLYPELQAFARTTGRREDDLATQLDFIAYDLTHNKPEIARYISANERKSIGSMTTEIRDAYMKPYVNKDSERVEHATDLQRLYNQQLKSITA